MAGVKFDINGNANGYIAATRQAEAATKGMVSRVTDEAKKIDDVFKKLATGAGSVFTLQMASKFSKQVAQVRGEFQQLEVAFETMLQSKEKADALMSQVVDTAAKTPFDLKGVANGAKQLLAYGVVSEEVNDTLIRLGDIAAGLSIPLNDLVYLYGTTMTQGRLFTQDLRQFQGRGIPIAEELAKQFGVTKDKIGDLVTEGKVGFPEVQKAIMAMTSEGGKFNNLMAKQSQTITGQISNLEDSISQMFNEIGKASEGAISGAISAASNLVENYETVGRLIGGLVTALGVYKTATITLNAVDKARTTILAAQAVAQRANTIGVKNATATTVLFAKAQKALNASMLTNPYVLAAAAVAALGVGIYALVTSKSREEKAFERVNSQLKEYQENLEKQKQQLQELFNTIESSNSTDMQRVIAMEQLRKLYPSLLKDLSDEELLKLSVAEATKELAKQEEALYKSNLIRRIADKTAEYEKQVELLKTSAYAGLLGSVSKKQQEKEVEALRYELELLMQQYKDLSDAEQKAEFLALPAEQKVISLKESNAQLDAEIAELDKKLEEIHNKKKLANVERPQEFGLGYSGGFLFQGQSEEDIQAEIKARQQQKALNDNEMAENQAKIDANDKALSDKQKKANYDRNKAKEKAEKELEKMTRDLNYRVSQADIDSMEEGYAKTLKQLKLNLQKENDAIADQKEQLLKNKYNNELQSWLAEDTERKAYDFKYTPTLTAEELRLFNEMGKQAQAEFDKGRADAAKKISRESEFTLRQFDIDVMSEGEGKDKAQRDLDNAREIHNLEMLRDAYIEASRAAFILSEQKKAAEDPTYLMQIWDEDKVNAKFDEIVAKAKEKQNKNALDEEREAWQNYYIEYGSFQEKVYNLTQQYNDKIAKAKSAAERASLIAERDKVLDELKKSQDKAYQNIFKDPMKMSLSSVKSAIALAKEEIKKITSKGVLNDSDTERLKILQESVDRLQSYVDSAPFDGFGDGLDGVVGKLNSILSIKKKISNAEDTGDEKAKAAAEEELAAQKELLKKNLAGAGVSAFTSGLTQAAEAMKEIAEASGDVRLSEMADKFGAVAQNLSAAGQGAASGGWIGAIVGGVTDMISQTIDLFVSSKMSAQEAINNAEDFRHELQLIEYVVDDVDFSGVFGMNEYAKAKDALEKSKLALADYIATMDEMNAHELTERYEKETNPASLGAALFGGNWASLRKTVSNEMKGALEAYEKGYSQLEAMQVKTKDVSGWGNFWGLQDEFTSLKDLAPELWGEDGVFSVEKAKIFLETNTQLNEEQRKQIQNIIDLKDAYDEANDIVESYLESLFGSWGEDLGSIISDSVLSGVNAWDEFEKKGTDVIKKIGQQAVYSLFFEETLNSFTEPLKEAIGNPEEMANQTAALMEALKGNFEAAQAWLSGYYDQAEKAGIEMSQSDRESTAKGIAQASQSSVDELNGRMTTMQSHTFSINERVGSIVNMTSQILSKITSIDGHTARLATIEKSLTSLQNDISDMTRIGIKVKM